VFSISEPVVALKGALVSLERWVSGWWLRRIGWLGFQRDVSQEREEERDSCTLPSPNICYPLVHFYTKNDKYLETVRVSFKLVLSLEECELSSRSVIVPFKMEI
jgi:hypothetical protein